MDSFHSSIALADSVPLPPALTGPEGCEGPTDVIESAHPAIVERALSLTAGVSNGIDRAAALFHWVRDAVAYDFTPDIRGRSDWSAVATLARGRGFCQQKALLLAALARAVGIPSAISFQRIVDHKLKDTRFEALLPGGLITFHGFTQLWLDGAWRAADATLDAALCARRGYELTELWPQERGRLPLLDLAGQPHFDILLEVGPFADMPASITTLAVSMHASWSGLRDLAIRTGATM